MFNKFTTKFKVTIAVVLIVGAFAVLGFNQIQLNKETAVAVNTSNQAVSAANQLYRQLHTLSITSTVTPTATPSATRTIAPFRAVVTKSSSK